MELWISLLVLFGMLAVGAMSPGPSFVFVAHTAITLSRKHGLAAAVGMGASSVLFSLFVLLGLQAIFAGVPWLYLTLKILGGAYLAYLAIRIWRSADAPLILARTPGKPTRTLRHSFFMAAAAQLSNPKAAVVYGSMFATLLPRDLPPRVTFAVPVLVFVVEAGWYAMVALVLSSPVPRGKYLKAKVLLNRIAGGLLGALGIKLVLSSSTATT